MVDESKNGTRFDIERDDRNPEDHLSSGYQDSSPTDYTIPSCEIEDVDVALHALFDKQIGFRNTTIPDGENGPLNINKPYVIFATGERFALVKKLRPPRDKSKQLMLPAISIRRKSITQSPEDITGRGMNQFTGDIVIRRRLAAQDRDYQNLLNKLAIDGLNPGGPSSRRTQGENGPSVDLGTAQGALLDPKLGNNVWEIISIPQPQFYTATYEVTFWTTHTLHMNYLIMTLLAAQLPQGKMFRLNTPKGYWFIATIADEVNSADNLDDFKEEKRVIRYTFQVMVKSFLLAPNGPGVPVPVRRTISATDISFELETTPGSVKTPQGPRKPTDSGFTLTDIERDPGTKQTPTTDQRLLVQKTIYNPVTGRSESKYARVLESNQKQGETVYYASGFESLEEFIATIRSS
jgi:hypothetical protein